jgi:localization factor PodJL
MKFGVPWHVKGVRREARETAREAARRSGMSVGEWLDTVILDSAQEEHAGPSRGGRTQRAADDFVAQDDEDARPSRRPLREERHLDHDEPPREPPPRAEPVVDPVLAELNHRLDSLTQQLDRLAQLQAANAANAHVARAAVAREEESSRQFAAAISKLDIRLDRLVDEQRAARNEIERRVSAVDRAVADLSREPPRQVSPAGDPPTALDQALIEIAERQRVLDGNPAAPAAAASAPAFAPAASGPLPRARTQELAGLERELRHINEEIAALKAPCGIDKAVDTLRDDLAEIGVMVQEAMPRKAVEALEGEVRRLGERVEATRHAGAEGAAIAALQAGLAEVRDALHALTPAESLAGFNEAVKNLSQRIDHIAGGGQDPAALKQLEGAILAMRGIVSHVASNDALATLSEEVRSLAAKVEQTTNSASGGNDVISSLERRIGTLADALEARNRNGQSVPHELDTLVKGLIDKIELIQVSRGENNAAAAHLEDRIGKLVEKLDASDARLSHLEAIERGLAELLIHIEHQRVPNLARMSDTPPPPEFDALKRDLADLKHIDKKTQDTLEAVHGALGHLVDRLAMIETDMRNRSAAAVPAPAKHPVPSANTPAAPRPAAAVAPASPPPPSTAASAPAAPGASAGAAKPIAEIVAAKSAAASPLSKAAAQADLPPAAGEPAETRLAAPTTKPTPPPAAERRPIDPNLPPDHPLEPGTSATRARATGSVADRIAASEAALGSTRPPVIPDPGGKSDFIAAARRAAQAAAGEAPARNGERAAAAAAPTAIGRLASLMRKHARSLIMGVSIVVIVAGVLHIVATWLGSGHEPEGSAPSQSAITTPAPEASAGNASTPVTKEQPPATAPGRQSNLVPGPPSVPTWTPPNGIPPSIEAARQAMVPPTPASPAGGGEITGTVHSPNPPGPKAETDSVTTANAAPAIAPTRPSPPPPAPATSGPSSDRLPASFGHVLRTAAVKGDPTAEYEVAVRLAEGRGVPQNLAEAAEWFERAAKNGLVPAQFRLGGHYEKGLGVKKNLDRARRLYLDAGEAGNAKALHNLAVLYAEGIDGKPDYETAAKWFRKAASYGIADSQYNLGVLYARGIGVEQNLAEAYKWFALAGREGDREALKKRDDVAGRLDRASLTTAQRAAEAFKPEPQPQAAIEVKTPPGGWDAPTASTPGGRRKPPIVGPKLDLSTPRVGN